MAKAKKKKVVKEPVEEQVEDEIEEEEAPAEEAAPVAEPLFQKKLGAMLKGSPRFTKVNAKSGMKEYEVYPGPSGITVRLYDKDVTARDRYLTYDKLAALATDN